MSWAVAFNNKILDDLDILEIDDNQLQNGLARDAFTESRDALVGLLQTGILGPVDSHFSGHISGHVNDNHEPLPGWSPDFVVISVSRVRELSAQDKAANQEGSPYA